MKKILFGAGKSALLALALVLAIGNFSPAQAAATGTVSGTVKVSVDGAAAVPLSNVKVLLVDSAFVSYGVGSKTDLTSGSDGTYTFTNVADGSYYVLVGDIGSRIASSAGPLSQDGNGVWFATIQSMQAFGYSADGAYARVTVAGCAAVTATDVTVQGFASVGTVSGSVLDSNGEPLAATAGMYSSIDTNSVKEGVYLLDDQAFVIIQQYADLTGHFSMTVPSGTYSLSYGDPENADFGGDFVFEDGTNNLDAPPTFALAKDAVSGGHNFVIRNFDLSKVVPAAAKIIGQIKTGADLKVTGLSVPTGATLAINWSCDSGNGSYDNNFAYGSSVALTVGYANACPTGKVKAAIEISKAGYLTASTSLTAQLKVVSSAKNKFTASSAKLIKNFPSISGLTTVGSVLHGNAASFKLAKVTKTSSTWFRCPSAAAAQSAKLAGCEVVKGSNANRTYKVTKYDAGSYLVYRVQVLKYFDSKTHGAVAPADSTPLSVSGY